MKRPTVFWAVVTVVVASALPTAGAQTGATGLDRAREVAAHGLEIAGLAHNPDHATGRERAAEAIAAALARGTGNGHGYGRGHSAEVLQILAQGGSPAEISGEHGLAVSALVHAYNELRRQYR